MGPSSKPAVSRPTKYVTLVSAEGFEFVVPREACFVSPVLKTMCDEGGGFLENQTGRMMMSDYRGDVVEKIAEYLMYWFRYRDKEDVPDMVIPVHMCLELVTAADYLGIDTETR